MAVFVLRFVIILLACGIVFTSREGAPSVPDGFCSPTDKMSRFEVLPGRGWDNLRNLDMGQVFAANYSECKYSDDGNYYLPVTVQLLPRKSSKVQFFSDVYTTFKEYTSLTSASINRAAHGDFEGKIDVSGSFSAEFQNVKTTQLNTKSITTRVQLRHTLYTAIQEPDTPLTTGFRDRLLSIAYQLESNNTMMVDYLADMVVADYGTHFTTTVDAGAVFASLDFVQTEASTLSQSQTSSLKMSAAVNFEKLGGFNRSFGISHDTNDTSSFMKNLSDSTFITRGGPALAPGSSAEDWVAGLAKNLVPVDCSGSPLYYAIHMGSMSSLSPLMVGAIRKSIKSAVYRYYRANTIIGCMERNSSNFNAMANVPSEVCESPKYNHTFGGVFQMCKGDSVNCPAVTVANPMTGDFSCSKGFEMIHLWTRVYKCHQVCEGWWIFKKCRHFCAEYSLFWCASTGAEDSSSQNTYLFGGLYNKRMTNPLTGAQSCPPAFYALQMGSSGLAICLSRDFELGQENSFEFGGFFSCKAGNPYTFTQNASNSRSIAHYISKLKPDNWPRRCPSGFAQHSADIDGSCEIMYCIKANVLRRVERAYVRRPPFSKIPNGLVPNKAPVPNAITLSLASTNDQWLLNPEKNSWSYRSKDSPFLSAKESDKSLVIVSSVLGSLLGTLCIGFVIALFILRRKNHVPLLSGNDNPNFSNERCIQQGEVENTSV